MAMVDSMGDPLHNIMHSMGTDLVMGWNIVCYTGSNKLRYATSSTEIMEKRPIQSSEYSLAWSS